MRFVKIVFSFLVSTILFSCQKLTKEQTEFQFTPDTTSVFRNPCMGWVMYSEGWELYPYFQENFERINVKSFWEEMDAVKAHEVSNILYIRAIWSAFEPEEGKYAWEHDPNFIELVEGAKKRNLKLAFRVFHNSRDQEQQATPEYVFQAGAEYIWVESNGRKYKNPYYDNPVFMEKFDAFVKAFAAEYDNPDITDFIDAYGAGLWGEGHGVDVKDPENIASVIDELTGVYQEHFKRIIPVYNLSYVDWEYSKTLVFEKKQFLPRRDGLGSHWFLQASKDRVDNYFFPKYPLIGEGCYWLNDPTGKHQKKPYENDKEYKMSSWPEAITVGMEVALNHHSNTYDLRVPLQAKMWIEECPDAVQKFITHGGYRFYPKHINIKEIGGDTLLIEHSWENLGVGLLPNNHPNWNYKYRISFALMDEHDNIVFIKAMGDTDPSKWVKGTPVSYTSKLAMPSQLPKGEYFLAVAITDRDKQDQPGIDIAVGAENKANKWLKIKKINQ